MRYQRIGEGGTKVNGKKAAAILFTDGKAILLLKRAGDGDYIDTWALPGGKSKTGETEIGCAIRETLEETGLDTIPGFRFDSLSTKNGQQKFTTFLYRVPKSFEINLSKEHSDYRWVNFDDLSSVELHPKFEEVLPDYLHMIKKKTHSFTEWASLSSTIKLFTS